MQHGSVASHLPPHASEKIHMTEDRRLFFGFLLLLDLGVVFSIFSFLPVFGVGKQTNTIIDNSFRLTPQETYRQGLGSFHGDENITVSAVWGTDNPVSFTLLTYKGPLYSSNSASDIAYEFSAGADYYEAEFRATGTSFTEIHLQVSVAKPTVEYPFSWLGTPAKVLFLISWVVIMMLILGPIVNNSNSEQTMVPTQSRPLTNQKKNLPLLKLAILLSLLFWLVLLASNSYPLATFENWYTDNARHPYTSVLFTKVGFSVFDTPLGTLSSSDGSLYKFVTWTEMPHLYPLGSLFLFLPFGVLLENGFAQAVVFKMEIALLLGIAHVCLYLFLKRFWNQELTLSPREFFSTHFRKPHFGFILKAAGTYVLYIVLVVYAANGQFDSVAFLFALAATMFFLVERYDLFLVLAAVSSTFKYQAGIFLLPLVMISLNRLFQNSKPANVLRKKAIMAAAGLAFLDLFTAALSAPFLMSARPELVMNGVNAFSPHAQSPWGLQAFAVAFTLAVTLASAVYLLKRNRLVSLFMVFALVPAFMMPYFQPWYLPFFFVYPLISQSEQSLQVTLVWLIFMSFILAFGGLAYNPLAILDNIRRILGF